ncbi:MAG TPA: PIG-L family deacetylase [Candidatus Hydrogenedentes bacterium]|nr:PIG-L family deacetylase [Candidatus Hydrogenedentota bacterium]HOJ67211.1 PIG-L family deacetylase [Candidatus Hydrogenedentota bacterium]HOK89443.1 PIG-L family deacetylase [Candidatus Hydrogenedentota bacterium]
MAENEISRRVVLQGAALATAGNLLPTESHAERGEKLKLLVAGAHPDDPESACGGTMALYADAGHEVVSLYLTRGEAGIRGKSHEEAARIRTAEAEQACRVLNARPVFLAQVDGSTELNRARYEEALEVIRTEAPDILITHWPIDGHRDHRVISMLMYDCWLKLDRRFALYYFEVETGRQTQHFHPTHYVDITSVEDRKRQACYAHRSQNPEKDFYVLHEQMHRLRGMEAGVRFAEAFARHVQSARELR